MKRKENNMFAVMCLCTGLICLCRRTFWKLFFFILLLLCLCSFSAHAQELDFNKVISAKNVGVSRDSIHSLFGKPKMVTLNGEELYESSMNAGLFNIRKYVFFIYHKDTVITVEEREYNFEEHNYNEHRKGANAVQEAFRRLHEQDMKNKKK